MDKVKVDAIKKMPCLKDIKGIHSFLGHVGFYRRFIKDFSKISRSLTNLLQKDVPFVFDEDCVEAFETFKKALTSAPIVQPPDWNLPLLGDVAEIQNFLRITKINLWSNLATRGRGVHLHTLVDRERKRSRERG